MNNVKTQVIAARDLDNQILLAAIQGGWTINDPRFVTFTKLIEEAPNESPAIVEAPPSTQDDGATADPAVIEAMTEARAALDAEHRSTVKGQKGKVKG